MPAPLTPVGSVIDSVYRSESRRVLATLIRVVGDFELAEEAMQEAFAAAVKQWPTEGTPANPRSWLVTVGRYRAMDLLRRRSRSDAALRRLAAEMGERAEMPQDVDESPGLFDDRLRLIFTCCHPALAPDAQVALTLREVCGLTTEEIARAYLSTTATLAQRIVRAKAKIRQARIPYEVPRRERLAERLDAVLRVIYLVFNEGYSASSGDELTRRDLSAEAIRLGRLLVELLPEPEAKGLLALMVLHESRAAARTTVDGELVLLEDQDRGKWDRRMIDEGSALVRGALEAGASGVYVLQAAIAALHAESARPADTDWAEIVGLYDLLLARTGSSVVALNRAVALAMRDGADAGLAAVDAILERGELGDYHLAHAARADLLRRLGRNEAAIAAYARALELVKVQAERRFLERRLQEMSGRAER